MTPGAFGLASAPAPPLHAPRGDSPTQLRAHPPMASPHPDQAHSLPFTRRGFPASSLTFLCVSCCLSLDGTGLAWPPGSHLAPGTWRSPLPAAPWGHEHRRPPPLSQALADAGRTSSVCTSLEGLGGLLELLGFGLINPPPRMHENNRQARSGWGGGGLRVSPPTLSQVCEG